MTIEVRNETEVKELIEKNKQIPEWISKARKYHNDWKALFYGENYRERLIKIEHIESEKRANARKKYTIPIKDLNQKLLRPVDAIYSAVGGSKYYPGIKSDTTKKKFLETISNLREGKSIEKFLETYWAKDLYIVDPTGLIFLEYYKDEWIKPVYKSTLSIRNYECNGQKLIWLLFEPEKIKNEDGKDESFWRYVDQEKDWTFKEDGDDLIFIKEKSFEHPFGIVPALICSNIQRLGIEGKLSPFDNIKEKQEEYLRDQGILAIYKFLNGFSTPVRPGIICHECRGTGKVEHQKCTVCDGTGELMHKDVTDEIIVPINLNAETINFPATLGYFITPDIEIWNKYEETLNKSTMSMYDTQWGMTIDKETEQTATEIMLNAQPKINKLNEWSDVAQYMEWQLTEMIANWYLPNKDKSEKISNIYYGRVYLIRTEEQILNNLSDAIKNNLPDSVKCKLYNEYITTKYKNDPETLMEELKKSQLEYWPFYTIEDVNNILGQEAAQKKMLFNDWWGSLEIKDKKKSKKELEKSRDKWIQNKKLLTNLNENGKSESKSE